MIDRSLIIAGCRTTKEAATRAPLVYGVGLALVTAAATIPALAGAAQVLSRDQVRVD